MTKHNKWKVLKVWDHIKSAMTSSSQSCVCAKQEKLITVKSKVSLIMIMYITCILCSNIVIYLCSLLHVDLLNFAII